MYPFNSWFAPDSFYSYCVVVPFISAILVWRTGKWVFPLLFLAFALPLSSNVTLKLCQYLKVQSAHYAEVLVNFAGVDAIAHGNIIYLANGQVVVNDECSGIRAVLSLLAISLVFAYLSRRNLFKRISLVLVSPLVALFANACRIAFLALITHFYGARYTGGWVHELAGALLYCVGIGILYFLYRIGEKT